MSMLPVGFGASGDYTIEESLRFNASQSSYLSWTPASAGNRQTWTWSGWVKRGNLSSLQLLFQQGADQNNASSFHFNSGDTLEYSHADSGSVTDQCVTTAVFRDPSAWYHIVLAVDTTQATDTNRVKIYINGNVQTLGTANYSAQNVDTDVNSANPVKIGSQVAGTPYYFDGYLTEVNFIDGQALDPTYFGETDAITGVWKPKQYTGTYGTNGFFLDFRDASTTTTLGYDYSGNSNNWTLNGFSLTGTGYCSMTDTPTPYLDGGNYAVLNPLSTNAGFTLSNANLDYSESGAISACRPSPATIAMSSGKWYWEVNTATVGGGNYTTLLGIWDATSLVTSYTQNRVNGYAYATNGDKVNSSATAAYGSAMSNGDVIGIAFNADSGTIEFFKNNTSQGTAFTGISGSYVPVVCFNSGTTSYSMSGSVNFGQRPFAYTPPTGFKPLHTGNLPDSSIVDGSQYFDISLSTTGTTTQGGGVAKVISGLAFQPDLVFSKNRSSSANARWGVIDSVRGVNKTLSTNITDAEVTSRTDLLTSFNSDGVNIGADAAGYGWNWNQQSGASDAYAYWLWKANGAGVSNTDGSITSTVSANPTAGFSIVTYTGTGSAATVGHGLGATPDVIISKSRDAAENWGVYHKSVGATAVTILNSTGTPITTSAAYNNTNPTSAVFTVNTSGTTNNSGQDYVAYCFAEVEGYSKFNSYTGNTSTDGPFVYTGFKPSFIILKRTDAAGYNWFTLDAERNTYNVLGEYLNPNTSSAAASASWLDFVSNGFKLRATSGGINTGTIIYIAFAENPFKNSLAR